MKLDELELAIEYLNEAIRLNPNEPDTYLEKGKVFHLEKNFSQALECFNKSIELNKKNVKAYVYKLSTLNQMENNNIELIKCYEKLIEFDPLNASLFNVKGIVLLNIKKYDDAILSFKQAFILDPINSKFYSDNIAKAFNSKGIEKLNQMNYIHALAYFNKALEIKPLNATYIMNKALVFSYQQKFTDALNCYNQAHLIQPDNKIIYKNKAKTLNLMGMMCSKNKNYKEAIDIFDKVYIYII